MLNLVNAISDDRAVYLLKQEDTVDVTDKRRMDLYISYDGILTTIGYKDDLLVWFSRVRLSDVLSLRRVFESVRWSEFYRYVGFADILSSVNLTEDDLNTQWRIFLTDVETDAAALTGPSAVYTYIRSGTEFAHIISHILTRLKEQISQLGSENDILISMERDLDMIANADASQDTLSTVLSWLNNDYLKVSRRASIRETYCKLEAAVRNRMKVELPQQIQNTSSQIEE